LPLTPGSRLGPYEIVAPLGSGGMGEVYRARDGTLGRDVAIKVLLASVAGDADHLSRFSREAHVLASLNHPNIAHIHGLVDLPAEAGSHVVGHALVMELVEGPTLAERIARGPIPLEEALPIAKQIADALEAAHEQGIIHRDLKPANIKVRPDGMVKVLDFGLAKAIDPAGGSSANAMNSPTLSVHATHAGVILGTAAYMSPEQARGKTVDRRADIWAFGAVLFEMLTGTRAFPGEDVTDTIVSVVSKEPDWTALSPDVPAGIRRLLRRSLEKDSKRRLDSAAGVRIEIDDALTAAGMDASPAGQSATTGRTTAGNRLIRLVPWGIAAAAVATLAVALAYPRRHSPDGLVRFAVAAPFGSSRVTGTGFSVSPDGQSIAFRASGAGGVSRIFVRRIDQTEAQPVAGTDNATMPFWSPDSRALAFAKDGGLYRTDLLGSAPRRLCDVPYGAVKLLSSSFGTWGASGVIVFATAGAGLVQVADVGGTPAPVTSLEAAAKEASHVAPWFLPDGRRVLFLALEAGKTRGVIWAVSIDSPARTRVIDSSGGAAYADGWLLTTTAAPRALVAQRFDPSTLTLGGDPQPVRDRLSLANSNGPPGFSVSVNGTLVVDRPPPIIHQLTWMDRAGRVLGRTGPPAVIGEFGLAPDERRVAASVTDADSLKSDLWLFEPQPDKGTRLTFQGDTRRPLWAIGGRHMYFTTMPNFEPWSLAVGATGAERLENLAGLQHFEDVTRDGRYLIFKTVGTPLAIGIQRIGAPGERRVLVQHQFSAMQPRVSPDGRWLAFTLELPRSPEVFVQPFDRPGERWQVSRSGGIGPIWRADSRELFYEGTDGLMAVPVTERGGALDFGTPQSLFPLRTQGFVSNQPHNVEVAANGQKFLVNAIVGESANVPLEVTLNWTRGLKK
jgi:hypothetical protein